MAIDLNQLIQKSLELKQAIMGLRISLKNLANDANNYEVSLKKLTETIDQLSEEKETPIDSSNLYDHPYYDEANRKWVVPLKNTFEIKGITETESTKPQS